MYMSSVLVVLGFTACSWLTAIAEGQSAVDSGTSDSQEFVSFAAAGARATLAAAVAGMGGAAPPPGSFVGEDALKAFEEVVKARRLGEKDGSPPDKLDDQWTISKAFRRDLEMHFSGMGEHVTALEVGSYFGYTTRLLSHLFGRVIALDVLPQFLAANREYNSDRKNIMYLRFHTIENDWSIFSVNPIQVVFLDASHDFETVSSDIENCLRLPSVNIIIFDDYGAEEGVRNAVHTFVARGLLRPMTYLGERGDESKPWKVRDGREIHEPEGIACEVVRPALGEPAQA